LKDEDVALDVAMTASFDGTFQKVLQLLQQGCHNL
jgi:hypothetical protein